MHLGALLRYFEALLEGLKSQKPSKMDLCKVFAIEEVLERFLGLSWLILGCLGLGHGDANLLKSNPKSGPKVDLIYDERWTHPP